MNRINRAVYDIHYADDMAQRNIWINRIHPLAKLIMTVWYMIMLMSFDKYNTSGVLCMIVYPCIMLCISNISIKRAIYSLRYIMAAILLFGISNIIFDRSVLYNIGCIPVTGGLISMTTLILKSVFAVLASYILIETTSIENICYAMRIIHIPSIIVTLIMLIYRYINLMLEEAGRITDAYLLRAPGQKGIGYKAWGSLAGHMLLRSLDRAQIIYDSMNVRGFSGEFYLRGKTVKNYISILYCITGCAVIACIRIAGQTIM